MSGGDRPPAQPAFWRMATGMGVTCFGLAVAFAIIVPHEGLFGSVVCLVVGCIMATIGATGSWPPRSRRTDSCPTSSRSDSQEIFLSLSSIFSRSIAL